MADIRCPMCGRPNPAEAEVCSFCGARIKPLMAAPGSPSSSGEEPDWLSGLRGSDPSVSDPASGEPDEAEAGDWLARIRRRQKEEAPQEEPAENFELPDWLSPEEPSAGRTDVSGSTPARDTGEGDWLSSLSAWQANEATPETSAGKPTTGSDDAPGVDWDFFRSQEEKPAPESVEPVNEQADGLGQFSTAAVENDETSEETAPATGDQQPDWLAQLSAAASEKESSETASSLVEDAQASDYGPPGLYADLPDWLQMGQPGAAPVADEPAEAVAQPVDETPAVPSELPVAGLPFLTEPGAPEEAAFEPLPEEPAFSAPPLEAPTVETALPFDNADLPDWLGGEPAAAQPASQAEPAGEELQKAQLPGWLKAMRPVEDVVSAVAPTAANDQRVESAGPLRGLTGALPGEDLALRYRKPPVYSARLHVSERQRQYAAVLEELLPAESQPQAVRAPRRGAPQQAVRLVVALALLLAVLYPLVTGQRLMPSPALYPSEMVALHGTLAALPPGAPVLLAVDYEPGLSGEMRLAASPVVDHLLSRQARLAIVSTSPAGPVLAEALLATTAAEHSAYSLTENVANLGFLAGGVTGLQEFARRPQMARPFTLDGFAAWNQPALAGVSSLQDFSAVVVLTESAETARAWIEQVQPSLGDAPMLMVVSAQSSPMVQPYLDSGQVQGMISGYSGGMMYAQITQRPTVGWAYWDAYQIGLFLMVVLILVGGVARLFEWLASLQAQGKKR